MSAVSALARVALIRFLRERSNLFFVFIFPLAIVLLVGATFGAGFTPEIVIVDEGDTALAADLAASLNANEAVDVRTATREEALGRVAAGTIAAVVIIPSDADAATATAPVHLEYVARAGTGGEKVRAIVQAEIERLGLASRALAGLVGVGVTEERAADAVAATPAVAPADVTIETVAGGDGPEFAGLGQFDLGAAQQLVLFTFITALSGAAGLIQIREWGIARRLQATPVSGAHVIGGLALGRWVLALFQAIYIVVATLLVFRVNWGSLLPTLVLIGLFAAVSAAAGLLLGAVWSNQAQANGVAVFLGLALAAIGGCMLPLEVMPDVVRNVAHATPHAWALDGFADIVRRDGSVRDILPELGVLSAFLGVLLPLGAWRLRVVLTGS